MRLRYAMRIPLDGMLYECNGDVTPTEVGTVQYTCLPEESNHAGIHCFGSARFLFAKVGTNRDCLFYVRSRSPFNVEGFPSVRLGGVSLFWFVLPNPRPDAKG
jgi:hypothetical protein